MKIDTIQLYYWYRNTWTNTLYYGPSWDKITGSGYLEPYYNYNGNPAWVSVSNPVINWNGFNKYNFTSIFEASGSRVLYSTDSLGGNGGQTISGKVTIDTSANIIQNRYGSGSLSDRGGRRIIECHNIRLYSTETDISLALDDKDFVNLVNSKQSYAKRMKNKSLLLIDLKEQKAKLELKLS